LLPDTPESTESFKPTVAPLLDAPKAEQINLGEGTSTVLKLAFPTTAAVYGPDASTPPYVLPIEEGVFLFDY
jgi:hypothetical protein